MPIFVLNESENEMVLCNLEASWFSFSDSTGQNPIRAEIIRRLLLRMPVQLMGDEGACVVELPGPGLRIRDASIEGEIDLREAAQPDGSSIPPMLLECCVLPRPLDLSGARVRALSLRGSRITHLRAIDTRFSGPVDLSFVQSAEDGSSKATGDGGRGRCWIELQNATFEGDLTVEGSTFVSPPRRASYVGFHDRANYALDLGYTKIEGTLKAQPRFTAIGGVSLRLARIQGNVMVAGAQINAVEQHAIDATQADIGGFVDLNALNFADSDSEPTHLEGDVWIVGAKIGGNLTMRGTVLSGELIAPSTKIGGGVSLAPSTGMIAGRRTSLPFSFVGFINFYDACIAGALTIVPNAMGASNARRIRLSNARIGILRDCTFDLSAAHVRLVLDGLEYDHWEEADEGTRSFPSINGRRRGFLANLRKSTRQFRHTLSIHTRLQRLLPSVVAAAFAILLLRAFGVILQGSLAAYFLLFLATLGVWHGAQPETETWRRRLAWLNLQYDAGVPTRQTYKPGAYERMTRALRAEGAFEDARQITAARLKLEHKLSSPVMLRPLLWPFAIFFGYGLSPVRAMFAFLFCLAIGAVGVDVADKGLTKAVNDDFSGLRPMLAFAHIKPTAIPPVLVVETSTVNSLAIMNAKTKHEMPDILRSQSAAIPQELLCDDQIDPLLYAADLFVPALQLHQVSRCGVSNQPNAETWRVAKAIYSALGWIVTALTILTVSGILRRQAEA